MKQNKKTQKSKDYTNYRIKKHIKNKRPVHKQILLHPVFILITLCIGVLIIGWTIQVIAASYTVSAVVPAPPLKVGANISSPTNNQSFTSPNITIYGTCGANSYVKLYINNSFEGVAWCSINQTFSITSTLFVGTDTLIVQDFNSTNQPGPTTKSINVSYEDNNSHNPLTQNNNPSSSTKLTNPNQSVINPKPLSSTQPKVVSVVPLFINSNYTFQSFTTAQAFQDKLNIVGGQLPYFITVNWGNNEVTNQISYSSIATLSHQYTTPHYYTLLVVGPG